MGSHIPQGRYSEPFASLNQSYRLMPGSVSKEKHCPSGEKLPNGSVPFSFATRVEFHVHVSGKSNLLGRSKIVTQTPREVALSFPVPSLPGCIELTLFEGLCHFWRAGEPCGVSEEGGKQGGKCMNPIALISSYY